MNPTITKNAVEKLFIPKSSKDIISQPETEPEIDFGKNELTSSYKDMMNRIDNLHKDDTDNEF